MQYAQLKVAIGGMAHLPQWFIWRLDWDATEQKYKKQPATLDGSKWPISAKDPANWTTFDAATAAVERLGMSVDRTSGYTLGFYLTANSGYWFLDIDKCVNNGELTPLAQQLVAQFPGAAIEWSSSRAGLHLFGRGYIPPHSMKNTDLNLEFYSDVRGIAFGFGDANGSADTHHDQAVNYVVSTYFPPALHDGMLLPAVGPREDWRGPTDDAELLALALRSRSAGAMFGTKASFADLYNDNRAVLDHVYGPDSDSERDMAMFSHLAFWTGCDRERMYRIAAASARPRDKWWTKRPGGDWLSYSIDRQVEKQGEVYQRAEREVPNDLYQTAATPAAAPTGITIVAESYGDGTATLSTPADLIGPEQLASVEKLLDMVGESPDVADIHNRVIPAVRSAAILPALLPRLENAINKRLDMWDAKLPVAKLRALLNPPLAAQADAEAPEFVQEHVYVTNGDKFFRLDTANEMTRTGFNARYNRYMPLRDGGQREDAAQWCLERWEMPVVDGTMYRPGHPQVFGWEGQTWANNYSPATIPAVASYYTELGTRGITKFVQHVEALMGGRPELVTHLFDFIAHNVQYPGVKIRHCPIIKGIEGDGKSIISNVLAAALGWANVTPVGPETVNNSGGFTDWAHGSAVTCFEELMITGRDRYRVSNLIKPFVTNNVVTINPKGGKPKKVFNTSNQIAFTNFNDAIPIANKDRRWLVIFTPFADLADLATVLGVGDLQKDHFDHIFAALEQCPTEWRKYFMDYPISKDFNANKPAMWTEEKDVMGNSGLDDAELVAREIVSEGGYGITSAVLSSNCLSNLLNIRSKLESFEIPRTSALSHMLTRMGYGQIKPVKWDGRTHRVWVKGGVRFNSQQVREYLDATKPTIETGAPQ